MHQDITAFQDIFLNPGEYFVGGARHRVRTLLGSCVSIVLWAPRQRVGGMSHFLLPGRSPTGQRDGRYAADALALMLQALRRYRVEASDCEAKIFGGGDMFPDAPRPQQTIGEKNGLAAHALLARHGIPVVSEDLYGAGHRKILFDVASGDVWARQVARSVAA